MIRYLKPVDKYAKISNNTSLGKIIKVVSKKPFKNRDEKWDYYEVEYSDGKIDHIPVVAVSNGEYVITEGD